MTISIVRFGRIGLVAALGVALGTGVVALRSALPQTHAESTGAADASATAYPPFYTMLRDEPFDQQSGTAVALRSGYAVASLKSLPSELTSVSTLYGVQTASPWTAPTPDGSSPDQVQPAYRLISAVRYDGGDQTVFVDVVQASSQQVAAGVILRGTPFTLPNGDTAYVDAIATPGGMIYMGQWLKGDLIVQVKTVGTGPLNSSDEVRKLAAVTGLQAS